MGASVDFDDLSVSVCEEDTYAVNPHITIPEDMTVDAAIARAARISYQAGTSRSRSDAGLIDYLMRHRHTSPFEMVEFKFSVKAPLFVVQQLLRHRTASVNQESARYSVLENEFYVPEEWRAQDKVNKQGSDGYIDDEQARRMSVFYNQFIAAAYQVYGEMIGSGVSREMARLVLPASIYTKLVWKIDLHNLLHFLKLRMDSHAQQEIREYAQAIYQLIQPLAPLTLKAWTNHVLEAVTLSRDELEIVAGSLYAHRVADAKLTPNRKRELEDKLSFLKQGRE